jgi:RNA polymerase sigma-70 factor, ECF subfamily
MASRGTHDEETTELVLRLQDGDPDAFDDLYRLHLAPLYGYMVVALHDHHEAEDAVHEVLLKMLVALPRYEHRGIPFRAWLFRIARNHLLDRTAQLRRIGSESSAALNRRLDRESASAEPGAWARGLGDDEFLKLIQWLPLGQRQVLILRFAFDMSFQEIALALGITQASARTLQRRAFQKLKPRLLPQRAQELGEQRVSRFAMRLRARPAPVVAARLRALWY